MIGQRHTRINQLKSNDDNRPFPFQAEEPGTKNTRKDCIKNVSDNLLNMTFFSKSNIEIIKNAKRHHVWKNSHGKFKIGNQSETQLQIIMRSIYLQYAKNLSTDIQEQVSELNHRVVEHSVPNIMSNIQQHMHYKKDINTGPVFMEHPENVSSAGSKSLMQNLF
jgi:hypothetical protein